MSRIEELQAVIAKHQSEISKAEREIMALESSELYKAIDYLANGNVCRGVPCTRCIFMGDCNFTKIVHDARIIRHALDANNYTLEKQ